MAYAPEWEMETLTSDTFALIILSFAFPCNITLGEDPSTGIISISIKLAEAPSHTTKFSSPAAEEIALITASFAHHLPVKLALESPAFQQYSLSVSFFIFI